MNSYLKALGAMLRTRTFWVKVLFVAIAALFWLLIKLSKSGYVSEVNYPVSYENIPANKILLETPTQSIKLRVTSHGFRLLGYALRSEKPLPIDVRRHANKLPGYENKYYWLPNLYREELQAQLDAETSLLRLEPDTIYLYMSDKVRKKVAVKAQVATKFEQGYQKYAEPVLQPDSVMVAGPAIFVDTLRFVATKPIEINGINGDVHTNLQMQLTNEMLSTKQQQVGYHLAVDQFTEKEISIPIALINVPPDERVTIFPERVTLFYSVALRDFDLLSAQSVTAVCDFDQLLKHPTRKRLLLDFSCNVPNARLLRSSAQTVDFLRFVP